MDSPEALLSVVSTGRMRARSACSAWASDESCEHGVVRPGEARPGAELAAQHRDLVAQRKQLDVLGLLR
ncbi:hypothetical protein ABZ719_37040 [Streptomyces sp. NPDC006743]|uniref:hypothetical protein n=1 Tax=Streptomyces sp. NPDC006743 TaxID=3154480 RepID=UPI00345439D4